MTPAPQWPMPLPQDQDDATLITEAVRLLQNSGSTYTEQVGAELAKRFGHQATSGAMER